MMRITSAVFGAVAGMALILTLAGCPLLSPTVSVSPEMLTIEIGETATLTARSTSFSDSTFTWTSGEESIVTVDEDGKIAGVSVGTTLVMATATSSGAMGSATVSVESPDTETPTVEEDVQTLDDDPTLQFESIDADSITFSTTGGVPDIQEDDILVGSTQGGYLVRVLSPPVQSGNHITYETEPATLVEAVNRGSVDTTLQFQEDDFKRSGLPLVKGGTTLVDIGGTVLYDEGGITVTIVDGMVDFAPMVDIRFDIIDNRVNYFRAAATGTLEFDLFARLDLEAHVPIQRDVTLFPPITKDFLVFIGGVPVAGVVELTFLGGIDANLDGTAFIEAGYDSTVSLTAGAEFASGEWSPVSTIKFDQNLLGPNYEIQAGLGALVYVRPNVEIKFYNAAGPVITPSPYLEAQARFLPSPDVFTLYAGLDSSLGFNVNILDLFVADFTEFIEGERFEIYSCNDCLGTEVGPMASFVASPTSGEAPLEVSFTDTSSPGSAAITTWQWNFGDGSSSSTRNPVHIYQEQGTYTVSLTINTAVESDSISRTNLITVSDEPVLPTANFTASPRTGEPPLTVNFTDLSLAGSSAITSWMWDFGDGRTSLSQDPVHMYEEEGTYSVSLMVTTAIGSDSVTKVSYIAVNVPVSLDRIEVLPSSHAFSGIGQTRQFRARAFYTDGSHVDPYNDVTWTTGDSDVATVNGSGSVTAHGDGSTFVRATSVEDTSKSDTASIEVNIVVETGQIQFQSTPSGATVRIAGQSRTTPVIVTVPSGLHSWTMEKEGYESESGSVSVDPGGFVTVHPLLTPQTFTISGTVRNSETNEPISGVEVRIRQLGVATFTVFTNSAGSYSMSELESDSYEVTFTHGDYEPETVGQFSLLTDRTVNASLDPVTIPPAYSARIIVFAQSGPDLEFTYVNTGEVDITGPYTEHIFSQTPSTTWQTSPPGADAGETMTTLFEIPGGITGGTVEIRLYAFRDGPELDSASASISLTKLP